MKRKLMVLSTLVLFSGCVWQSDFDTYKAGIKADGDALDAWVAGAHTNIIWLRNMVVTLCTKTQTSCDPPAAPPTPPPDGAWGS
jgi:hypothetical protein